MTQPGNSRQAQADVSDEQQPVDNTARMGAKYREVRDALKNGWRSHKRERFEQLRPWLNEQFVPRLSAELHAGLTRLLRGGMNMMFKTKMAIDVPAPVVAPPTTPET